MASNEQSRVSQRSANGLSWLPWNRFIQVYVNNHLVSESNYSHIPYNQPRDRLGQSNMRALGICLLALDLIVELATLPHRTLWESASVFSCFVRCRWFLSNSFDASYFSFSFLTEGRPDNGDAEPCSIHTKKEVVSNRSAPPKCGGLWGDCARSAWVYQ